MTEQEILADLRHADITVVGNEPADAAHSIERAVRILTRGSHEPLSHGGTFTGRPGTWIFHDEEYVLKLHTEFNFSVRDSNRWILNTLSRSDKLDIYDPLKCWLVLCLCTKNRTLIANLSPKLEPLHQITPGGAHDAEQVTHLIFNMLDMYLGVAAEHQLRLDEGLSNFGLSTTGRLYYLDDDIYRWDNFTSLAQAIGHWCRALDWLDADQAYRIGAALRSAMTEHFPNTHDQTVLSHQLHQLTNYNSEQKAKQQSVLKGYNATISSERFHRQIRSSNGPLALIADIHANWPAFEAVLNDLDRQKINNVLVLGDIVGYGPHPQQCIAQLRDRDFTVIKGNHDHAVGTGDYQKGFSTTAKAVATWTRERLSEDDLRWLTELPSTARTDDWFAVHGAPTDSNFFLGYVYRMTYEANLNYLREHEIPICFHGHTHLAGAYYISNRGLIGQALDDEQDLSIYQHSLICPGSVGQPRERLGTAARYAIYDPSKRTLSLRRSTYDVDATIRDLLDAGLPDSLALRLKEGY